MSNRKLTPEMVATIHGEYSGGMTMSAIAAKHGLSIGSIKNALRIQDDSSVIGVAAEEKEARIEELEKQKRMAQSRLKLSLHEEIKKGRPSVATDRIDKQIARIDAELKLLRSTGKEHKPLQRREKIDVYAEQDDASTKESGLVDAIDSARLQLRLQKQKMDRAEEDGDEQGFARASRLHIAAATLLGRLCIKDDKGGIFVSKEEIEQSRALMRQKMKDYLS